MKLLIKIIIALSMGLLTHGAMAGHMFTQGSSNVPTWIQAGQGIAINQERNIESPQTIFQLYMEAPSQTPSGVSGSSWWKWSAGDVAQISIATTGGTQTYTIAYDANPSCTYSLCGVQANDFGGEQSVNAGALSATTVALNLAAPVGTSLTPSNAFTWVISSLAGDFSIGGFRIGFNNGTLDGSSTGPLNQNSVVSANNLPPPGQGSSTPSVPPIDTATAAYTDTQLNNNQVLPKFAGGVLSLASAGNVTTAFTVTSAGGTINTGANNVTFSGAISDHSGTSGALRKSGAGLLVLSGANTFTGGVSVEAGKLSIAADSNLGAASGAIALAGGVLQATETMTTSRAVTLGGVAGSGVEVTAGKVLTSTGAITGTGGMTKSGAGVLALSSGTHTFTGGVNLTAGELKLNATLSQSGITVASGARLSGAGVVGGAVALSGTVAPGNSPGTLTIAGDMTMTSASTYVAEIDGRTYSVSGGAGSYDRINLTGAGGVFTAAGALTPILRGISAPANNNFDPIYGDRFRIVATANATGVTGAFSGITDPVSGMPANSRFDVIYGANYIDLTLTPASLGTFARTLGLQNMVNAAQALDGVRPSQASNLGNDRASYFAGLYGLNTVELARALLMSSGQIHAVALGAGRTSGFAQYARLATAAQHREPSDELWLDVTGYSSRVGQDHYATPFQGHGQHIWLGKDLFIHQGRVIGAAVGQLKSNIFDVGSNATIGTNLLTLYLLGRHQAVDYDLTLGYGRSDAEIGRTVTLSSGIQQNYARPAWSGLTAQAGIGRQQKLSSDVMGRAYTRLAVEHTRTKAFAETGSALTALTAGEQNYTTAQLSFGYDFIGRIPQPSAYENGFWRIGLGTTILPSGRDTFVDRTVGMHGTSWSVREASFTRVMPYMGLSFNQRVSRDLSFVASWNHIRSGAMLWKQTGYVGLSYKL